MSAVALPSVSTTLHVPPGATWDGRWLVCFGEDWGRHNSTAQYLALALAAERGASLVWVDSLGLREPRLNRTDAIRVVHRLGRWLRGGAQGPRQGSGPARTSDIDLHVISPLALPFLRFPAVRRLNRLWVGRQLRRRCRRLGVTAPLLITASPASVDVLDCLDPVCRVYYCADEHASLPDMNPVLVHALEAELLARVDLVFASARALVAAKGALHPAVSYLPHGVHVAHFAHALEQGLPTPAELRDLPRPIAGYVGLIGRHLDLASIAASAEALTGGSVVLIGPVEEGLGGLPRAANLHYLGPRPHAELPQWLRAFEVALLPWNDSERNHFAHPAKVREYLAAGCPVVAREHPELDGFGHGVTATASAAEFAAAVAAQAAAPVSPEQRADIARSVNTHDWQSRARTVSAAVAAFAPSPVTPKEALPTLPGRAFRQAPVAFRHRAGDLLRAFRPGIPVARAAGQTGEWGFASARGALLCVLRCLAAQRPEVRRVIVPAWTCWSVAAAVEYAGLEPVCCDVDPIALDFEPDDLARCLREPALAVIATHLLGAPPDLGRLRSHPHVGCIIEDAAQAADPLAPPLPGVMARLASAARGKPLAAGGGGWLRIVDTDSELAHDLSNAWHRLPATGRSGAVRTALTAAVGNLCLHPRVFALVAALPALEVGITRYPQRIDPARADAAQSALWTAGASRVADVRATRRRTAAEYAASVAAFVQTRQPVVTFRGDYAPYRFPVYLDRPLTGIEPRDLAAAARAGVVPMYPRTLVGLKPPRPWSTPLEMPGAHTIARRLVTLPTHEGIGARERRMALAALQLLNGGNGNGRHR